LVGCYWFALLRTPGRAAPGDCVGGGRWICRLGATSRSGGDDSEMKIRQRMVERYDRDISLSDVVARVVLACRDE
jgi:hypothetical protein